MDRLFDRLGDLLRTVLGSEGSAATDRTSRSTRRGRPSHIDDPDLAAAWDELDSFLESEGDAAGGPTGDPRHGDSAHRTQGAAAADDREHLRRDYATLEVAFEAPMSDVKRAYKRLMQAHHPDRFARDPRRQAAATRTAARINAAYSRIEHANRPR